ncbi:uncharacterized protein LOC144453313 isoform X1 [Glandiceps talaboti]
MSSGVRFTEIVEVPLNYNVTLILDENGRSITSKDSGFPVGLIRTEECQEFWNSVEENRLVGDVCQVFENITQHFISDVKEQTASDTVKNELLNFLCHTGAVRLKFIDHKETSQIQVKREITDDIDSEDTQQMTPICDGETNNGKPVQWVVTQQLPQEPEIQDEQLEWKMNHLSSEDSEPPTLVAQAGPSQLPLLKDYLTASRQGSKKIVNQVEVENVMKLKEARQRQKLNGPRQRKPSPRKLGYTGGSSPVKKSNVKKPHGQSMKKRPSTSPLMETTVPQSKRKSQNNATAAKKHKKGVTREVMHERNRAKCEANKAKTAARNSEAAAYFAHKFSGNGRRQVASQTQTERPSIPPTIMHKTSLTPPPPQQTSTGINRQQASLPQSFSPTFTDSSQQHMEQQSSGYQQVFIHSTISHASKYTGTTSSPVSSSTPRHADGQYSMDDHTFDTWQHTPNDSSDDVFGMAISTVNETLRDDDNPMSFPFSNANGSGGTCTSTNLSILNMDDGKQSQPTGVTECHNCAMYKDEIKRLKPQRQLPVPSPEAAEYMKRLISFLCGMKIEEQGTNNNHQTQSMNQTLDDTRLKKPGPGMTQLVPNEPVYMSTIVLTGILSECEKDAKKLFHKLIEYYFPVEVLAVSTGSDVKQSAAGKIPLDQSIVKTLKSYARAAAFKNNEKLTDKDLNRVLTNKCTAAKRSREKKLKGGV